MCLVVIIIVLIMIEIGVEVLKEVALPRVVAIPLSWAMRALRGGA